MKRKLVFIAIPIILSITGIVYFQIDRMYKTYNYEVKKINSIADLALQKALNEIDNEQMDTVTKFLKPKFTTLADSVNIVYVKNKDTVFIELMNFEKHKDMEDKISTSSAFENGVLSSINASGPQFNITQNKQYLNYDKNKEKIITSSSSTNSDRIVVIFPTIITSPKRLASRSYDYDAITAQIEKCIEPFIQTKDSLYYPSDSVKICHYFLRYLSSYGVNDMDEEIQPVFTLGYSSDANKQLLTGVNHDMENGTFLRQYNPLGLNAYVGKERFVGIYFHGLSSYVLSRIFVGSLISVLLILIMITSFIYLIRTILTQKRLADMKDDFINNLTHEFKTPIATIAVAIEGMQSFNALNDLEKTNRYLTISKNELSRLNSMVSNVLNLASQEKNSIELAIHEIDFDQMVQEIIGMEYFRTTKTVKFTVEIDNDARVLRVDPLHFKNVITNLVDNAVKYAKETVEITIATTKENDTVCILVKDNGIGIPKSELKYVFDKFYRVSTGNIYNVKGIGLGLSYVKSIITLHQGTISVKSTINVGTEFSIFIPLN